MPEEVSSLETIESEALHALEHIKTEGDLTIWRSKYLSSKGVIREMVSSIGSLRGDEHAAYGQRVNALKQVLTEAYDRREQLIREWALAQDLEHGAIDVTLPGRERPRGHLHPSTHTLRRFYHIWAEMGFQIYRTREVEDDDHNFTLLNFPPDHPARDTQDTFYTTEHDIVLRTQSTAGQVRAMCEFGANGTRPMRLLIPGMCFRYEQISVRSDIQFHQVDGLVIGRNIRMSDLMGTLREFTRKLWGPTVRTRFRNSYFPFVEPGMETDVECYICGGHGCRVCKHSGWIEIGGSGMVHPNVLRNGGYDPALWSGFAFGLGIERMNLNVYDVRDIRLFWQNDLRLLQQF